MEELLSTAKSTEIFKNYYIETVFENSSPWGCGFLRKTACESSLKNCAEDYIGSISVNVLYDNKFIVETYVEFDKY